MHPQKTRWPREYSTQDCRISARSAEGLVTLPIPARLTGPLHKEETPLPKTRLFGMGRQRRCVAPKLNQRQQNKEAVGQGTQTPNKGKLQHSRGGWQANLTRSGTPARGQQKLRTQRGSCEGGKIRGTPSPDPAQRRPGDGRAGSISAPPPE